MTETITINDYDFRGLLELASNVAEDHIADLLERYQPNSDLTTDANRRRFRREANEAYETIALVDMFRCQYPERRAGQNDD